MRKCSMLMMFILFLLSSFVFSQSLEEDVRVKDALHLIETWLESQLSYEQYPGISAAIVYKQNMIWKYALGYSDPEKKIPTTTKTIYSICSISKLFTSIALMQLRDQGKLRLDDPVGKHLPWFKIEQVFPESPPITIESILTHSSGLPRESDYPYWNSPSFDFPSREKMIEQLKNQKTLYPAYTYYQYSNLGLTLAGEIVSQVSGMSYEEYVTQNILEPLGLEDTRPYMPENLYGDQLSIGYSAKTRKGNRDKMPFFQANAITPAAGFSSTAEDLAKFAMWQLRLLESGKTEILQTNTLKEMYRVHWLDPDWETTRGLGFGVYRNNGITFVGHSGSCPGYRTAVIVQPNDKIGTVFMTNTLGVNSSKYAQGFYRIIAPVIKEAVDSPGTGKATDPELLKYCGTYTFDPWGGEVAVVPWKGELAMAFFPDSNPPVDLTKLKQIKDNLFQRLRSDGETGEEIEFIIGKNGKVESMKQHSNFWKKIR